MKTRKKISARLLVIMLVATLLLPFTWNVPVEAAETKQIDALMDTVDKNYLADFGYTREEVLAEMMLNSTVWKKWVRCTKS